jgi:hypothetical protein
MEWMGLMMISCGMTVKWMGMLGSDCKEEEATDCEDSDSDTDW